MALLFYLPFHLGKIALELPGKGMQILDFVSTLGIQELASASLPLES